MHLFKSENGAASSDRGNFTKRLAFFFCVLASAIGWAAIIGLVLLLKPELFF